MYKDLGQRPRAVSKYDIYPTIARLADIGLILVMSLYRKIVFEVIFTIIRYIINNQQETLIDSCSPSA